MLRLAPSCLKLVHAFTEAAPASCLLMARAPSCPGRSQLNVSRGPSSGQARQHVTPRIKEECACRRRRDQIHDVLGLRCIVQPLQLGNPMLAAKMATEVGRPPGHLQTFEMPCLGFCAEHNCSRPRLPFMTMSAVLIATACCAAARPSAGTACTVNSQPAPIPGNLAASPCQRHCHLTACCKGCGCTAAWQ